MSKTHDDKTPSSDLSVTEVGSGDSPLGTSKHTSATKSNDADPNTISCSPSNPISNQHAEGECSHKSRSGKKDSGLKADRDIPSCSKDNHSRETLKKQESGLEEERRVGEQGRLLLKMFINERARNTLHESIVHDLCEANPRDVDRLGMTEEQLSNTAIVFRRIGDDIGRNVELNNYIDQIPVHSSKTVFERVCVQVFEDGEMNWGRVFVLFYFAYRLTVRALDKGLHSIPWVRQMLTWAGDFLVHRVAGWVCSRGGWKMINKWFGSSNKTWMLLCVSSIALALWFYFRKN